MDPSRREPPRFSFRRPGRSALGRFLTHVLIAAPLVALVPIPAEASLPKASLPELPPSSDLRPAAKKAVAFIVIVVADPSGLSKTAFGELLGRSGTDPGRPAKEVLFESEAANRAGDAGEAGSRLRRSGIVDVERRPGREGRAHVPLIGWSAVMAFTSLVAAAFSLLPARLAARTELVPALKSEVRQVAGPRGRVRMGELFVSLQVAVASLVLVASGLLLRTLWNASRVPPGFDASKAVTASIDVSRQGQGEARGRAFFAQWLSAVRALPGVRGALIVGVVGDHRARSLGLAFVGLVVGLLAAVAAGGLLSELLFGVAPADPWNLLAVAGVLVLTALVASLAPARRALRVDPTTALRSE